jgi:hypothetical protein
MNTDDRDQTMTHTNHVRATPAEKSDQDSGAPDAAALEADIAQRREELADTIDQLTARLDVKSRVHARASQTKADAAAKLNALQARAGLDKRVVVAAAGALIGLVSAAIVLRRRRSRR